MSDSNTTSQTDTPVADRTVEQPPEAAASPDVPVNDIRAAATEPEEPTDEPLDESVVVTAPVDEPAPLPVLDTPDPFDGVPEPLKRAMVEHGFETLLPVQRLVLEFSRAGKNLRISSQTGSGKTVALGLALSESLLELERSPKNKTIRVLIVTPTRELASQVADELTWLFQYVPQVSVAVVTGGTDPNQERKQLERRPTIVVGTPGRLLDHMRSGVLRLDDLDQVVLDEADRMLDMGFREELDELVEALPDTRQSHLMSATFPEHVLALANRFQGDAIEVQPTEAGTPHEDIAHVVYLVPARQTYAALVNVLLLSQGARCLVFVQRRVDAADLAEKLASDGFSALPFSGDLSQTQRNRTLHAFRHGIVKTLISTDVAARGIDVPDIATVIHMDIPDDAETYVHRSGRTGRAGRKGRSLMIAPASAQRRIRRLLEQAGIQAAWLPVPKPNQVRKAVVKKARRRLRDALKEADSLQEKELRYAASLLEQWPAEKLIATLLRLAAPSLPREPLDVTSLAVRDDSFGTRDRFDRRGPPDSRRYGRANRQDDRPRRREGRDHYFQGPQEGYVRFFINWGGRNGASPSRILSHVCRRGNVSSRQVGAIRIGPYSSTFEVTEDVAQQFEQQVKAPDERDPDVYIRRWREN